MFKQLVCGIYTCKKNLTDNSYGVYDFARMPLVNNNIYLDLAKRDFNRCQVQHQLEWHGLQK
jgi:ent-copalyl diphosphate synthase